MSFAQFIDPKFVASVNQAVTSGVALQSPRRNAANTGYEYALPVWSDGSYTDPSWLTSIPSTKVTGLGALATLSAAPAVTLTGTTLAANVVSSSLTSVGTLSSALAVSTAGAVSAPAMTLTGAWFTSGTATTTKPHLLIEPVGTTSTGWGTAGTGFGVNAANTFLGDLLSLQKNGVNKFSVAYDGRTTIARTTMSSNNVVMQVGNGATGMVDYTTYYASGSFYTYQAYGSWDSIGSDSPAASILAVGGFRSSQWVGITLHAGGSEILRIQNSGTAGLLTIPAAGVVGLEIRGAASQSVALVTLSGRSSTTDGVAQAAIDTAWVDSTHATRKARLILRAYDTAARDGLIIEATGSAATLASAATASWSAAHTFSVNGTASTPPMLLSGAWFSGGSATTTKPQLLVEPSGTTSTGWSTSGTGLGINAASGFAGNLLDLQIAGVSKCKFDGTFHGIMTGTTDSYWYYVVSSGNPGYRTVRVGIDNGASFGNGRFLIQNLNDSINSVNFTPVAIDTTAANNSLVIDASGHTGLGQANGSIAAQVHALTGAAATLGLIVEGTTSQSGVLLQLRGKSSTTAGRQQADIDTAWVDSTDATRKARLILRAYDTAARDGLIIEATGSAATLSSTAAATWSAAHVWAPTASGAVAATFKASTTSPGNIMELQSSGGSVLSAFTAVGYLSLPAGTVSAPAVGMQNNNVGFYQISTNLMGVSIAGTCSVRLAAMGVRLRGDAGVLDWASGSDASAAADAGIYRVSAGVVALSDVGSTQATALALRATSSTTAETDRARLTTVAIDNTHATRKYRLVTSAYDTAARETSREWADGSAGRVAVAAPASAPTDAHIAASQVSFYLDEAGNNLKFRVCYADGTTYKTGTVALS